MNNIQKPTFIDFFGLILLSAIWGSSFIAMVYALNQYDPLTIAFGRVTFAGAFLLFFVYLKKQSFPRDVRTLTILFL